jgi:hypothetical protein
MAQPHVAARILVGQIQSEGERPRNARFITDVERSEEEFVTVTAHPYTVVSKRYILADDDTAGGGISVLLPLAREISGFPITIKKLGTTGNITINPDGVETVDGSLTKVLITQYETATVISDGIQWWII